MAPQTVKMQEIVRQRGGELTWRRLGLLVMEEEVEGGEEGEGEGGEEEGRGEGEEVSNHQGHLLRISRVTKAIFLC